jgi:argininosuccinate lyase
MGFVPEKMRAALSRGFLNATDLADYLAARGVPFRKAHRMAGQAVAEAEKRGLGIEQLPLDWLRGLSPLIEEDIYQALDFARSAAVRESPGGTGAKSVRRQIAALRSYLKRGRKEAAQRTGNDG